MRTIRGLGKVLRGDSTAWGWALSRLEMGTLSCVVRVLQTSQPLQVGKAQLQPAGLGGAPLQLRVGIPPKSQLRKCIYLTALPKPGTEPPQTNAGKRFAPCKVSSQPTSSGRTGWLGHAHRRLASPAWGSFSSQWSNGGSSRPTSNDSAHWRAEPSSTGMCSPALTIARD